MKACFLRLSLAAFLLLPGSALAQEVVLSLGPAGVRDVTRGGPALGLALEYPITGRLSVAASYQRWLGENHVLEAIVDDPHVFLAGEDEFHGNQGLDLVVRFALLRRGRLSFALGAGAAAYQFTRVVVDEVRGRVYRPALSLSALAQWQASRHVALRVELKGGFGEEALESPGAAEWAFVNLGVGYRLRAAPG